MSLTKLLVSALALYCLGCEAFPPPKAEVETLVAQHEIIVYTGVQGKVDLGNKWKLNYLVKNEMTAPHNKKGRIGTFSFADFGVPVLEGKYGSLGPTVEVQLINNQPFWIPKAGINYGWGTNEIFGEDSLSIYSQVVGSLRDLKNNPQMEGALLVKYQVKLSDKITATIRTQNFVGLNIPDFSYYLGNYRMGIGNDWVEAGCGANVSDDSTNTTYQLGAYILLKFAGAGK